MKKKVVFISILIAMISIIAIKIPKKLKQENNNYTIETYIDGKLAAAMPNANAGYKVNNIICSNGATASFNYSSWRLEVSNISSNTLCTLEFVSNSTNTNFNTYLENKKCSGTSTSLSDTGAANCLVNENGYRYEGEDPNNYIIFNDELWRIIGLFTVTNGNGQSEKLVRIIRDETLDGLSYHRTSSADWTTSDLQNALNVGYLNATDTDCYHYNSNIKTCKFSKTGIKDGARDKIENVVWTNVGNITSSINTSNAGSYYSVENKNTTTWTGRVGLMYASDYAYGVLAKKCPRTTAIGSYLSSACAGKDWLKKVTYEWTINHVSIINAGNIYNTGYTENYSVRPSVYLKSSVKYISGTGTYNDPYIIS